MVLQGLEAGAVELPPSGFREAHVIGSQEGGGRAQPRGAQSRLNTLLSPDDDSGEEPAGEGEPERRPGRPTSDDEGVWLFDSGRPTEAATDSRPRPVHRALGQHPVGTAEHHPPAADVSRAGAAPAPWSWPVVGLTVPADRLRASPDGVGAHRWLLRTPACGCARPASSQASPGLSWWFAGRAYRNG